MLNMSLEGKVALVTGGASGLGAAIVEKLAEARAQVFSTDINDDAGREVATRAGATFLHQDVTSEAGWSETLSAVAGACGRLDILVNNAGMTSLKSIADLDLDTWNRTIAINLTAVMLGCREGIKMMRTNPGGPPSGSIINISSTGGILGSPYDPAYCAAKAGVRLLTKSIAAYCALEGTAIRCNSIHPGVILTPMVSDAIDASDDPELTRRSFAGVSPRNQMGTPCDIAAMALFLASDLSSYATGAEFVVDGGATCAHGWK